MRLSLNGQDWVLMGYKPFEPFFNHTQGKKIGVTIHPQVEGIPATVPGSIHDDLLRANYIKDPGVANQSLSCEWVENRDWVYRKSFIDQRIDLSTNVDLVFEGLNHKAHVYFNDVDLGEHHNPNTTFRIDVTSLMKHENTLEVVIYETTKEQGQIGGTQTLQTMTQYFGYGWDFGTRLVGLGIFRDVYLDIYDSLLEDLVIKTSILGEKGKITIEGLMKNKNTLHVTVEDNNLLCYQGSFDVQDEFKHTIWIDHVKWWYVNGYGDPHLYRLTLKSGELNEGYQEKKMDIGFKSVRYLQNDSAKSSLPYTFEINGKRVWIRGVSMTNLDHMLGRVKSSDYAYYVEKLKEMNVNLVRLWGGGVREQDEFYRLCDQHGILVWQDFFQSQSSAWGNASLHTSFLSQLSDAAIETVKMLRNHVSTLIYCGGNELKDDEMKPLGLSHPNMMMLQNIVRRYHPEALFYPTTPSGPRFSYDENQRGQHLHHNVHGPWTWHVNHFSYYRDADWLFLAEFGVNALSHVETLKRIIPSDLLHDLGARSNPFWSFRNKGWWHSTSRDQMIFGDHTMITLEDQSDVSQFLQSEGIRYAIERNRSRAFECSGNIIWQFNEPWPNIECTSIIDYDRHPKYAFYGISESYRKMIISASFDDMSIKNELIFNVDVSHVNGISEGKIHIEVWDLHGCIDQKVIVYAPKGYHQMIYQGHVSLHDHHDDIIFLRLWFEGTERIERVYYFKRVADAFRVLLYPKHCPQVTYTHDGVSLENDQKHPLIHRFKQYEHAAYPTPWVIVFPNQSTYVQFKKP